MRFENPWILIFLPVFYSVVVIVLRQRSGGGIGYSSIDILGTVRSHFLPWIIGALIIFSGTSIILALSRPQVAGDRVLVPALCRDTLFLVDQSQSLRDNKFSGEPSIFGKDKPMSQLEAELFIARELISARPNDRIGLMFFSDVPTLLWPLSHDHGPIFQRLNDYVQKGTYTIMGPALLAAVDHLEELGECGRTLIVLTDGYVSSDNLYTPVQQAELRQRVSDLSIQFFWVKLDIEIYQKKRFKELEELSQIHGGVVLPIKDNQSLQKAVEDIKQLTAEPRIVISREEFVDIYPWMLAVGIFGAMGLIGFIELLVIRRQ